MKGINSDIIIYILYILLYCHVVTHYIRLTITELELGMKIHNIIQLFMISHNHNILLCL